VIRFIVLYAAAFAGIVAHLIRRKSAFREIAAFAVLAAIGFAVWIGVFTRNKINPNRWIGMLLDWFA